MAIVKDYTDPASKLPIAAAYHRLVGFTCMLLPFPTFTLLVGVYASQAARQDGAEPVRVVSKALTGDDLGKLFAAAFFKTFVGRLYAAVLKLDPTWAGGADAVEPGE